jgi:hypothetical protein
MRRNLPLSLAAVAAAAALIPAAAQADGVKRAAAGADPASIQGAIDAFRADIGGINNGGGAPAASGRREINWDGAPDTGADPNPMRGDAFLGRGVLFATRGTGFKIGADDSNPTNTPPRFGNPEFQTFSPQRLFTAVGSPIVDNLFFLPGSDTPATTNAMGVVFTDVDAAGSAKLEYFDPNGNLLDTVVAPPANGGLSFAGETFTGGERVARVRITSGTSTDLTTDGAADAVAMDDFLFAEPKVVAPPAPAPGPVNQPPAKDGKAPKVALLRLLGGGIRFVIASDEPGTYRVKVVITSAQAKKLKLKQRTVFITGTRTLQGGGNTVSIKISKRLASKLHKAKIKPLLTLDATDTAGNRTTRTQRVTV